VALISCSVTCASVSPLCNSYCDSIHFKSGARPQVLCKHQL
jgi:hypothetical protein